jgi:putative spermidine/putrescine transport system substrate-binding protein
MRLLERVSATEWILFNHSIKLLMISNVGVKQSLMNTVLFLFLCFFALVSCVDNDTNQNKEPINVVSYGGYWQEVIKQSMYLPFTDKTSILIIEQSYDGSYSPLQEEALYNVKKWDVVNVETNMVFQGKSDGITETIDYSKIDTDNFIPEAIHSHGVGLMTWSWVMAYNKDVYGSNPPKSWVDFFDIERYPGSRGLQQDPRRVIEIALIADGVPTNQLYPLDVDRALTKLKKLHDDLLARNQQLVWWNAYSRPAELLDAGIVTMSPGTNGRILQAIKSGITKIDYTWNGGIIDLDWWVIMKNSTNKEQSHDFINYASSVQAQREMSLLISYGPVNNAALASLPEDVRRTLPTYPANLEKQFYFNTEWWGQNYDTIIERWNRWRLEL